MRGSQEELGELGPLLLAGRLEELRSRMGKLWPPEDYWEQDDVGFVTMLLLAAKHEHSERAGPLYAVYAERLKRGGDDLRWLQTLNVRARVVWAYEGGEAATAWLRDMSGRIYPPNNGVAHLTLGGLLLDEGRAKEALPELRTALPLSLSGMEWYSLEALNEMIRCQLLLGDKRLAFEYMKAHATQSYRLGRIPGSDLIKACKGHAVMLGELDYLIDLESNVARSHRERSHYSAAALSESEVGLALARIGMVPEACGRLSAAAEDAERGSHPNDPAFALACRLLARFIDPAGLTREEMARLLGAPGGRWADPAQRRLLEETRECVRGGGAVDAALLEAWTYVCGGGRSVAELPSAEKMRLLILNHLAALLGRYYEEDEAASGFESDEAVSFYAVVLECGGARDVITTYVRARLAECLLKARRFDEALAVCKPKLEQRVVELYDRFLFRQLAARCSIHADGRAAYRHALNALADWRLILDGLYVEEHKVAWLRKGADCLDCAIRAISEPVDWLPDDRRRRELFRLSELGKARILSDMINSRGYLPRPYKLFDGSSKADFFIWDEGEQDWNIPLLLQGGIFADVMSVQVHDESGATLGMQMIDLTPLRDAITRPVPAETRLLTTAVSLAYDESDLPSDVCLYEDVVKRARPERGA